MPNIGSRKSAGLIRKAHKSKNQRIPDGWERIGAGSYRTAYLNKAENVVYKVSNGRKSDGSYDNLGEIKNARALDALARKGKIGAKIKVPLTSGYTFGKQTVVAMQFIKGRKGGGNKESRNQLYKLGFADMHAYNFIKDKDGFVWPVDMGSPRNGKNGSSVDSRCLYGGVW